MVKTIEENKRYFIMFKGWISNSYNEIQTGKDIKEYLEWVRLNSGMERLHYDLKEIPKL